MIVPKLSFEEHVDLERKVLEALDWDLHLPCAYESLEMFLSMGVLYDGDIFMNTLNSSGTSLLSINTSQNKDEKHWR
jgi:hypothetical protein